MTETRETWLPGDVKWHDTVAPTAEQPKVTVRKVGDIWHVTCPTCDDRGDFLGFLPLAPWAKARRHEVAMLWARWHVERHRDEQCPTCSSLPAIPRPKPLKDEPALVRLGGVLYRTRGNKIERLG